MQFARVETVVARAGSVSVVVAVRLPANQRLVGATLADLTTPYRLAMLGVSDTAKFTGYQGSEMPADWDSNVAPLRYGDTGNVLGGLDWGGDVRTPGPDDTLWLYGVVHGAALNDRIRLSAVFS